MTINFTFWLILMLSISVVSNILMFWYIRVALGRIIITGGNLTKLINMLVTYSDFVKSVYELENYYGDEDIKQIIVRTNNIIDVIEQEYSDVLYITSIIEYEEEGDEEPDEEKEISEENVFYAGSRKRDT